MKQLISLFATLMFSTQILAASPFREKGFQWVPREKLPPILLHVRLIGLMSHKSIDEDLRSIEVLDLGDSAGGRGAQGACSELARHDFGSLPDVFEIAPEVSHNHPAYGSYCEVAIVDVNDDSFVKERRLVVLNTGARQFALVAKFSQRTSEDAEKEFHTFIAGLRLNGRGAQ